MRNLYKPAVGMQRKLVLASSAGILSRINVESSFKESVLSKISGVQIYFTEKTGLPTIQVDYIEVIDPELDYTGSCHNSRYY